MQSNLNITNEKKNYKFITGYQLLFESFVP